MIYTYINKYILYNIIHVIILCTTNIFNYIYYNKKLLIIIVTYREIFKLYVCKILYPSYVESKLPE